MEEILSGPVGRDNYDQLLQSIYRDHSTFEACNRYVKDLAARLPRLSGEEERDMLEKVGILRLALGDLAGAVQSLEAVKTRKTAAHFLGRAYLQMGREKEAIEWLERGRSGEDDLATDVLLVEAYCRLREPDKAEAVLSKNAKQFKDHPDYQWGLARIAETRGQYEEAMAIYQAVINACPNHTESLFRLAFNCDLNGQDDEAIRLYQECLKQNPAYMGALVNLGVLYEDQRKYAEAIECYKRALALDPTNPRARLYLKGAESSLNMFVDLERVRQIQRMEEILQLPIEHFELSARARSCLEKLGVKTLGGLSRLTRDQLLAEKNFGETSLQEVEELLARHGLELSEAAPHIGEIFLEAPEDEEEADLSMPVSQLEMSTRCRKCMEKLGIKTVGDLIQHTEKELLEVPNFGTTSLEEVKSKLAALGLSLKSE